MHIQACTAGSVNMQTCLPFKYTSLNTKLYRNWCHYSYKLFAVSSITEMQPDAADFTFSSVPPPGGRLAFKSGLPSVYLACTTTFTVFSQPPTLLSSNGMIWAFVKGVPIKIKSHPCLPAWILNRAEDFAPTYRQLINNWHLSSEKLNSTPLVSNEPFEKEIKDHNLQQ